MISIVAIAKNGVIGKTGSKLPWHIPEDLKIFKHLTTDNVIIMGRKTFESIGKPLPNRVNLVISRTLEPQEGIEVFSSPEEAFKRANTFGRRVFIIGGADLFKQTIDQVDELYVSHLKKEYEGDIYFPEINWDEWKVDEKIDYKEFEHVMYSRK